MSVQTEIDRISTAVQNAHLKVVEMGGASEAPYLVAGLADAIGTIPQTVGEDVTEETATYSELLTDLEAAVDALPDATSGSTGEGVLTCTVELSPDLDATLQDMAYTYVDSNGSVTSTYETGMALSGASTTLEGVVCGSLIYLVATGTSVAYSLTNVEVLSSDTAALFKAPTTAGAAGIIGVIGDD